MERQVPLEPVAAYDRIAPEFKRISDDRRAYLDSIERLVIALVIEESRRGARTLLDVGAGDGTRSLRVVKATGLKNFVLLEPSAGMRGNWPPNIPTWPIRAEELWSKQDEFDVITCLWNVLGHIHPAQTRVEVLRQCARLLSPQGVILIDVNHRYNARHYGWLPTLLRMARDRFLPGEQNGDVTARWSVDGATCSTKGHVFTDAEFRGMANGAGLAVRKVVAVDYRTGEIRSSKSAGSLLYVLQRAG
jgi:2-polyprenyl-3-methyl-5-hydroxy-6-metoxy-1,4-benzoquinol methylase